MPLAAQGQNSAASCLAARIRSRTSVRPLGERRVQLPLFLYLARTTLPNAAESATGFCSLMVSRQGERPPIEAARFTNSCKLQHYRDILNFSRAFVCARYTDRTNIMQIPTWVKPAVYGAGAGAVALAIIGFTWGGWVTRWYGSEDGRQRIYYGSNDGYDALLRREV